MSSLPDNVNSPNLRPRLRQLSLLGFGMGSIYAILFLGVILVDLKRRSLFAPDEDRGVSIEVLIAPLLVAFFSLAAAVRSISGKTGIFKWLLIISSPMCLGELSTIYFLFRSQNASFGDFMFSAAAIIHALLSGMSALLLIRIGKLSHVTRSR